MSHDLHGLCITKNETDIIQLSLLHAAKFCKAVYVLDNGSTDDTWSKIQVLSEQHRQIIPFEQKNCRYGVGLRGYIFNRIREHLKPGDWLLILDSDEFLEVDPSPTIDYCENNALDLIFTYQAQFYITEQDLDQDWFKNGHESIGSFKHLPTYFLINWREPRLFKYKPSLEWPDLDNLGNPTQVDYPRGLNRRSPKRIVNRHYQYRSLPQIRARLRLRADVHQATGRFKHNREADFIKYIRNSRRLQRWIPPEKIRATFFDFIRLYLIRRSKRFKRMINNRTLLKE